jgi:hexokinase
VESEQDALLRKQREQVIQAFRDLATATANLVAATSNSAAVSKKQIEITNSLIDTAAGLAETIMIPKDGLRDVVDELIDEVRGLREDLRVIVQASGLKSALTGLFEQLPRGKKL